jgi:hypothetical protein
MKHHIGLFIFFVLLSSGCTNNHSGSQFAENERSVGREKLFRIYPFKSAVLKYHFDGDKDAADGTRTVYIDQWGAVQGERVVRNLSNDDEEAVWIIIKGLDVYTIDADGRRAVKTTLPQRKAEAVDVGELMRSRGSKDNAVDYLIRQGIQVFADEEVAGYRCRVVQKRLTGKLYEKQWIHRGVVLRRERYLHLRKGLKKGFEEVTVEARFDVPVDSEQLSLPAGIEIVCED